MRWKKKHEPGACSYNRCGATEVTQFPAGVYHHSEVYLCDRHIERAKEERAMAEQVADPKPVTGFIPKGTEAELQMEAKEASDALDLIRAFEIQNQDDYDFANEALGDAKTAWKTLEARKKEVTKPLNEVLKMVRSWFKPAQDFYSESERLLKSKLVEAHKKAAEEQDRALVEAQQAHTEGDAGAVRKAMLQAAESEIQQAQNVTVMNRWCFEITDPSLLPREYLCPDMKAIQETVRLLKNDTEIPGVRVFQDQTVIRRGA